jgi:hypothetical protein
VLNLVQLRLASALNGKARSACKHHADAPKHQTALETSTSDLGLTACRE